MKVINIKSVQDMTTFSKNQIRILSETGDFPKSHKISERRMVWIEHEVIDWLKKKLNMV